MNCINQVTIEEIKKEKKKYVIMVIITAFLFCLSIILLFLITSREYEQLFIILFALLFAILINLIIYFITEHIKKASAKIDLYKLVLSSNGKKVIARVKESMGKETYSHVVFNAYRVIDDNEKAYRILLPENFILDINQTYGFELSRNVVISYEQK